jgi:Flp pilus assembly protein TadG
MNPHIATRRRPFRLLRAAREGTAAVEFALLAVPFLMLSLGTFEIGRLIWTNEALQETAAVGARCMGVLASACASAGNYSQTNTETYIVGIAGGWNVALDASALSLTHNGSCGTVTGFSQVTITYTFQTVLPTVLTTLSAGIPLSVQACFPNQT